MQLPVQAASDSSFYFNLHEMGFLTYVVVIAVILLEFCSTKIKAKVK